MTLTISVRDYRGIERADIELEPLALVAGRNEEGKSSLAEATRAVLAVAPIPIPGVNKKDAKVLVRDGAEKGYAKVEGDGTRIIEWPKASVTADDGDAPIASEFAVGYRNLLDLFDKERAQVLARYVDSEPTREDLAAAMKDASYSETAFEKVWAAISKDGWDATYKRSREHGTKLKGQWEGVTGEKYGAKKGEEWTEEKLAETGVSRDDLVKRLSEAEADLEEVIGQRAVDRGDVDRLRVKAEGIPTLEQQEQEAAEEWQSCHRELETVQQEAAPKVPSSPTLCPSCQEPLILDPYGLTLIVAENAPTAEEIAEAEQALADYQGRFDRAQDAFNAAANAHGLIENRLNEARQAAAKLEEIEEQQGDGVSEAEVEAARKRVQTAKDALAAYDARVQAGQIHAEIVRNAALADILAPDGLRRRKLAAGLQVFNDAIGALCGAAGWPSVRLDENLSAHYGARPVWAASASGRWRARTVVQIGMALMDRSAAVVIDEADILDAAGRNGLIDMLRTFNARALVCMTANRPESIPDLEQAGLGQSYWVTDGLVQRIHGGEQQSKGAA